MRYLIMIISLLITLNISGQVPCVTFIGDPPSVIPQGIYPCYREAECALYLDLIISYLFSSPDSTKASMTAWVGENPNGEIKYGGSGDPYTKDFDVVPGDTFLIMNISHQVTQNVPYKIMVCRPYAFDNCMGMTLDIPAWEGEIPGVAYDTISIFDTIPLYDTIPIYDTIQILDTIPVYQVYEIETGIDLETMQIKITSAEIICNFPYESIKIYSLDGILLCESESIGHLSNGVYILDLQYKGQIIRMKFLKQ